jgi:hypothetical protein
MQNAHHRSHNATTCIAGISEKVKQTYESSAFRYQSYELFDITPLDFTLRFLDR